VIIPPAGEVGLTTNAIMHSEPMHSGIQETWIRDVRCAPHPRTVVTPTTSIFDHAEDLVRERGMAGGRIGVAGEYAQEALAALQQRFPQAQLEREATILPRAMALKTEAEIQVLKRVARAADSALAAVMEGAREGVSEFELSALANAAMFGAGAEETAFPIALASGPRAGFKHVPPQARTLKAGDWLYVDLGCRIQGYYSDASRNRVVGRPTSEQRDFSQANLEIVHRCIEAMRPGVAIGKIAEIAERVAREWKVEQFLYFRGHGIGTGTHVPPSFSPQSPTLLEEGMVFVFEPMLVRTAFGTACVEDMFAVRARGCERLSAARENWWD
jgi:Xaa-Pro dipeptidase